MRWNFSIPKDELERAYSLFCEEHHREPGILEFAAYYVQNRAAIEQACAIDRILDRRQAERRNCANPLNVAP